MEKRSFLKLMAWCGAFLFTGRFFKFRQSEAAQAEQKNTPTSSQTATSPPQGRSGKTLNLGVDEDGQSRVYLAQGDSAEENMRNTLALLGGITSIIDKNDIVVLKPNAQWWNQGMTNTDAMKAFMEEVLAIPGFAGEIIIADNHQFADQNSRGWNTEYRNGAFNYNELVDYFNANGFPNVSKYHWRCAGPNPNPLQGNAANQSKLLTEPGAGDGYIWRDDMVYHSSMGRKCMMTYPVFTSAYSGITIDLKDGAWKDGHYTGQLVKFINFSVINHHSSYCGVTASIKNFMGVVDMTCGFQGSTPKGYHNTHYIGKRTIEVPYQRRLPWRIRNVINQYNWKNFHHTAAVLGMFMREVRKADLNIITAHWVGYASRTDIELSGYPKTILASRDPVGLDYVATQEILLPLTISKGGDQWLQDLNNADNKEGPFYRFLEACHQQKIGNLKPEKITVVRHQGPKTMSS